MGNISEIIHKSPDGGVRQCTDYLLLHQIDRWTIIKGKIYRKEEQTKLTNKRECTEVCTDRLTEGWTKSVSNRVNWGQLDVGVNCSQLRSIVVNCSQLRSIVVNCSQLKSNVVKRDQLGSNKVKQGRWPLAMAETITFSHKPSLFTFFCKAY